LSTLNIQREKSFPILLKKGMHIELGCGHDPNIYTNIGWLCLFRIIIKVYFEAFVDVTQNAIHPQCDVGITSLGLSGVSDHSM
jgi:hypothetical protein